MSQGNSVQKTKHQRWWVLSLLVGAVYVCSFAYIALSDNGIFSDFGYPIHNGGDSSEYALLTQNLADYGAYSLSPDFSVPEMFRSPGYSFFLAPLYALDNSFYFAIFAQILLVVGCALLIYEIGKKFLPEFWALICGLFFALDPTTIFYSLSIFSDTLFTFLTLLAVYLLFIREKIGWGEYALAGLVLGFGALVRSAGEYLVIIFAVFALYEAVKRVSFRKAILLTLLFLVSAFAVVAPWYVRNFQESGAIGLSTTGPYTFLFYHVKDFEMRKHGVSEEAFIAEVKNRLQVSETSELRNIAYSKGMMDIVKEKIFADPINYGIYHISGSINLFLSSSLRDLTLNLPNLEKALSSAGLIGKNDVNIKAFFSVDPLKAVWYSMTSEPLFTFERLLRLFGLQFALAVVAYAFFKRRFSTLFLLMTVIVAYTALVIGPVSYPRYRIPLEPFLYLLTALSVFCFFPKLASKDEQKDLRQP